MPGNFLGRGWAEASEPQTPHHKSNHNIMPSQKSGASFCFLVACVRKCDLDLVRHLLPSFSSAARVDCLLAWQMTLVLRGVKRDRDVKWNMKRRQEDRRVLAHLFLSTNWGIVINEAPHYCN